MVQRARSQQFAGFRAMEDGSTLLIAFIQHGTLYVANVGDSRAVLVMTGGRSVAMSKGMRQSAFLSPLVTTLQLTNRSHILDHKPDRKDEKARLEAQGGRVTMAPAFLYRVWPFSRVLDVPRVNGCLAMSRSIGDQSLKPLVSADPEITAHPLVGDRDRLLILATDGLWDVCSSKRAAKIATNACDAEAAAEALLEYALRKKTRDNVTVLVIDLAQFC